MCHLLNKMILPYHQHFRHAEYAEIVNEIIKKMLFRVAHSLHSLKRFVHFRHLFLHFCVYSTGMLKCIATNVCTLLRKCASARKKTFVAENWQICHFSTRCIFHIQQRLYLDAQIISHSVLHANSCLTRQLFYKYVHSPQIPQNF